MPIGVSEGAKAKADCFESRRFGRLKTKPPLGFCPAKGCGTGSRTPARSCPSGLLALRGKTRRVSRPWPGLCPVMAVK